MLAVKHRAVIIELLSTRQVCEVDRVPVSTREPGSWVMKEKGEQQENEEIPKLLMPEIDGC